MRVKVLIAAALAAVLVSVPLAAQDVTLVAREGGIVLSGSLQGYDGEFYRIQTSYGLLTVDGEGVICEGPACPDLVAPKAVIRVVGESEVGLGLLAGLFQAFADQRGLLYRKISDDPYRALVLDPGSQSELADLRFDPLGPADAATALLDGSADLKLGFLSDPALATHSLAMDALVAITAPDNPTARLSTGDLARILSGEVENWAEVGGPDMPLVLHALRPETDMQAAIEQRLGRAVAADVLHAGQTVLAESVARDPWAIAVTGRSTLLSARRIPLTDSCGFPLLPTPLEVKAEDYPLALPLMIQAPKRRLPLMTREFLNFLRSPTAQSVVAASGFVDRSVSRKPMTADGMRLINAIKGAGEDVTLGDLKRLAGLMDGADRVSLTFRFEDGSSTLDARSLDNLADLAQLIAAGQFRNERLVLAGFSDGSGPAEANLALSVERAARVAQELAALAPDLPPSDLPTVEGFGEALPLACDETAIGRQLNRRVELWVLPDFTPDGASAP